MIDPFGPDEQPEYETVKVSGLDVTLVMMPDYYHEYGGNYTYGWKVTIGKNQYGDFVGHIDTKEQARRDGRDVLLEQCALTIEAIRKKEAINATTQEGTNKREGQGDAPPRQGEG